MIRFAVPKGHLEEESVRLLERSGIGVVGRSGLFARTNDPEIELVFVRAEDVPNFVGGGSTDLGITGFDLVCERGADVVELLDLGFGRTKLALAAPQTSGISTPSDLKPGLRVATEFPNLTSKYFRQKGIEVEIVRVTGAAEISPLIGVADLITDVTETGSTLRLHGLKVVDVIVESTARLIANRGSLREKGEKIGEIKLALESVVLSRGRKLVLMNIPEEKLAEIRRIMPGMAGPTVSRVEAATPMLAVQAVVEEREVYRVIREAKQIGARDILVVPIERVVP
ncbi:MAG: ATP phosphoribosyltransferase [Candidatus Hadarchaeales archaeon]